MKLVDYEDANGRKFRVEVPDDAKDDEAEFGIPVGPPPIVDFLKLPEPIATQLHNELHRRGIWNEEVIRKSPGALLGAIQAVMRVDAQIIHQAYIEYDKEVPVGGSHG